MATGASVKLWTTGLTIACTMSIAGGMASAGEIHVYEGGSIQDAINVAIDGDEIIVHPGTYCEAIDLLDKGIWLHSSDGADVTAIDATGLNTSVVTCNNSEDPDTVLEGFTITGGNAYDGGGLYCWLASPTVIGCVFINNHQEGGSGGGGIFNYGSNMAVIDCAFIGNTGSYGGGFLCYGHATVTNCSFIGNWSASYGGAMVIHDDSHATLTNCVFAGNRIGYWGGALYIFDSDVSVINCTFTGNYGPSGGSAILNYESNLIISNCVLWGDVEDEILNQGGPPLVRYSNVQGGHVGEGNIDADPMFTDPGYWDDNGTPDDPSDDFWVNGGYELQAGSPCIDAGYNNALPADADDIDDDGVTCERFPIDLAGDPRFSDDLDTVNTGCGLPVVVDMGAFEFAGLAADVVYADVDGTGLVDIDDLFGVLGQWGECSECCLADVNDDGTVDIDDIFEVLGYWGPCP